MYFFYIDESGSRDPKTHKVKTDGTVVAKDHLYVLTAVALFERRWLSFQRAIAGEKLSLMRRLHRDENLMLDLADCEVKSVWLRIPKQRESQSRFLSALVDAERTHLARTYYRQLVDQHMQVFSVVVDKRKLHDHMDHLKLHMKAYELLLERIEQYLAEYHPKHQGMIVMDDTDKTINRALTMKHAWFQREGNNNLRFNHIVEYPFFSDSKLSNGVQLADLCGYNVYRAFHDENFSYPFFADQLSQMYRSRRTAQTKLDGLKVWPEPSPLVAFAQNGWQMRQQKQPGARAGL